MDKKIIKTEKRLCPCCMEEHDVKTVIVNETSAFKDTKVEYGACYLYCDKADEYYMDEHQIRNNDISLKNAYRKKKGLLTSYEIISLREKYGITQSDLCTLLGWGGKTVTRYESSQVQDKAHDTILRKIDSDPEWFLSLLYNAKEQLSEEAFEKYRNAATLLYEKEQDVYLRKSIEAGYARFHGDSLFHGNTRLSLDKVVDVIRYIASSKEVTVLYKVKLMKMLWYTDALSYRKRGAAITGLVYQALPMGAVPVGHNSIINLRGVPCEEVEMGETNAYHFCLNGEKVFPFLSKDDTDVIDIVIKKLGKMNKDEIVEFMHKEKAYTETAAKAVIIFNYAKSLQI